MRPAAAGTAPVRKAPHARRARLVFAVGVAVCALAVAALFLLQRAPDAYTPGLEAATGGEITNALGRGVPRHAPRIPFTDAAAQAGIDFHHFPARRTSQLPEDMGSGAAWGDFDDDGDPDLYLVNASPPADGTAPPARAALFRNEGSGRFLDVTQAAGVGADGLGMGAAWGDYDADGKLDLVVTRFGRSLLYHNEGNARFLEVSAPAGIAAHQGFWTGASWADYDRDGDLDLYICGYVRYLLKPGDSGRTSLQYGAVTPWTLNPSSFEPERNLLLRNDGGRFTEVARAAGVDNLAGRSLSASWCDFDGDGWPDLYVANDISDNAMFWNRGDGTFKDVSHSAWVADYRGAMGLGIGDWDNDGDFDIFITHWIAQENGLYENIMEKIPPTPSEPMRFIDQADILGLGQVSLDFIGWGTAFLDYDNDGRLDLFAVNGSTFQEEGDPQRLVAMRNQLFWNAGAPEGFYEVGAEAGPAFAQENVGRGAAFADYDGDGDLDAAVMVHGGRARLLRNDGQTANGWVRLILRGAAGKPGSRAAAGGRLGTTTFAHGARVRLVTDTGLAQVREIGAGSSYLSQDPPGETHFGTGAAGLIDRLEIRWPGGRSQSFEDLPVRATIRITEGERPEVLRAGSQPESEPGTALTAARRNESILKFWDLYHEATRLRSQRELDAAIAAYRSALAIDPRHEDCLYYLGQLLQERGARAEARAAYERLVEANAESARGHLALGALLTAGGDEGYFEPARAEVHLRRAHEINGEETGPMVRLGEVLIVLGDEQAAGHWLESAARTNPKSTEAAFLSGYLRWRAGDGAGAQEFYDKAVRSVRTEAPIRGVLNEGDRKSPQPAGAAPPLKSPMGRTLFGAFSAPLSESPASLDSVYAPVLAQARALSRRATATSGRAQ